MASTFFFGEDNGNATDTPARGTTRTTGVTQMDWKNTDDVATSYATSPITAGNNSYSKYQFGVFTGSFNEISNVKFNHVSGVWGAGITVKGVIGTGYATPSTTTVAAFTSNFTPTGAVSTGYAMTLGTVGPQSAGAATLAAPGYTCYIGTQLQTTVAASPGNISSGTWVISWDES